MDFGWNKGTQSLGVFKVMAMQRREKKPKENLRALELKNIVITMGSLAEQTTDFWPDEHAIQLCKFELCPRTHLHAVAILSYNL